MLRLSSAQKIYIYREPVDMRKAINGLLIILQTEFNQDSQSGDVYIFCNRARNKIKCLCWDKNGYVLYYKRIERGRFMYSKYIQGDYLVITPKQLEGLFMGLDFYLLGHYPEEKYSDLF